MRALRSPEQPPPERLRQSLGRISAQFKRLDRMVGVLLEFKYSPRGGGVRVRLARSQEEVVLSVSDDGVGIPPEEYERIFEPFQRSRSSRAEIPGIGLELSVSRRIARPVAGTSRWRASRDGLDLPSPAPHALTPAERRYFNASGWKGGPAARC